MSQALDWSILLDTVQNSRDQRARYFKPTCLFAVSLLIDDGLVTASRIYPELVIDRFSELVSPVFPSAAPRGWMPFWHLTNDNAWNCFKDRKLVKNEAFPSQGKPRGRTQLSTAVDYASVPESMFALWQDSASRHVLRKKLVEMLLTDDDVLSQAEGEYLHARFLEDQIYSTVLQDEEIPKVTGALVEDYSRFRAHLRIERSQTLIRLVKKIHKPICALCGMNFENVYGEIGKGYIEAHHLRPVASMRGTKAEIDPAIDFVMLCANCHRMIHKANSPSNLDKYITKYGKPRISFE